MPQLATICYIDNGKEFLMLHRNKKPNDVHEGKWIGVGLFIAMQHEKFFPIVNVTNRC